MTETPYTEILEIYQNGICLQELLTPVRVCQNGLAENSKRSLYSITQYIFDKYM